MAGVTKRLAKAVSALAASGVVKKAVVKAASDPRVRRKAAQLQRAAGKKARVVGKAAGKRARVAGKAVRKVAGKKIQRLGTRVEG
jgi:hypothetical protein